jgi:hypothetical protein
MLEHHTEGHELTHSRLATTRCSWWRGKRIWGNAKLGGSGGRSETRASALGA